MNKWILGITVTIVLIIAAIAIYFLLNKDKSLKELIDDVTDPCGEPGPWHAYGWAGNQNYGRGLHAASAYNQFVVGDLVQVHDPVNPSSEYNGVWDVIAIGDDTSSSYDGRLVGIGLSTPNASNGLLRKVGCKLQPVDNIPAS